MNYVRFERSRKDERRLITFWEGKIAFADKGSAQPNAEETWTVEHAAINKAGTVYFLHLGERLHTQEMIAKLSSAGSLVSPEENLWSSNSLVPERYRHARGTNVPETRVGQVWRWEINHEREYFFPIERIWSEEEKAEYAQHEHSVVIAKELDRLCALEPRLRGEFRFDATLSYPTKVFVVDKYGIRHAGDAIITPDLSVEDCTEIVAQRGEAWRAALRKPLQSNGESASDGWYCHHTD